MISPCLQWRLAAKQSRAGNIRVFAKRIPGADIKIDGAFAGNTPSTLSVTPGQHTITVKKKGYTDWTRTMNVSGTAVHLTADLNEAK